MPEYEFVKGHGTENDFVLLPDLDGTVPRRAVIAKDVEPSDMSLEQLDEYYKPENYEKGMYA